MSHRIEHILEHESHRKPPNNIDTEKFVPSVVPGLSSSSSGSSSTSETHSRQESHSWSSSSTSSSSPTTRKIQIREREDATNSDTSPVPMSDSVGDRSGRPDETQTCTTQKPNKKETAIELNKMLMLISLKTETARSVHGPKLQMLRAEDAKANPYLEL